MTRLGRRLFAAGKLLQSPKTALTAASLFDFGLQLITPVVLVRLLDPSDVGLYRLFWLIVNTAAGFGAPALTRSLFYFLPRVDAAERRAYINQTLLFLAVLGGAAAIIILAWMPTLALTQSAHTGYVGMAAAFTFMWIAAAALDALPIADERIGLNTRIVVGWALLRTAALCAAAFGTGKLSYVLLTLCALVGVRLLALAFYVRAFHQHATSWRMMRIKRHLSYIGPLTLAASLYGLRLQADPWIVAHWFSAQEFAAFSLAMVILPLINILRQSICNTALPEMNRLHGRGDHMGMLAVAARANATVASISFPATVFLFAFADPIVNLVFTPKFAVTADVLRVYCFCFLALSIDASGLVLVLNQSRYAIRVNLLCLILSVPISVAGAHFFGLAGAALGSTVTAYVELLALLRRAALVSTGSFGDTQSWRTLWRLLGCAVAAAGAAYAFSSAMASGALNGAVQIAFSALVCAISYLAMTAYLRLLPDVSARLS